MTLQPGTRLGPYEILTPLGAGGMGEVYKARDARLERLVAVKVLPEHLAKSPEALARFEREARAVAALNHPNITGIFDLGNADGVAFVAMELLEGESLRARLEGGPLPPKKAAELAIQLAQGLAAAHEKGVVHRDLKPDNLWITREGRLKILDFGLAKQLPGPGQGSDSYMPTAVVAAEQQTEKGMILGTLGYMSPEQVRGEAVDARADLFSLGVVLFEMLTGRRAFARDTASDTMAAILRDDPPELEGSSRPIPLTLRRIIDHCLEKAPSQRFQDARDVAFALESLSSPEAAAPISAPFAPQNRRATRIWAAVALVLLAAAGFGGWSFRGAEAKPTFKRLTFGKGTVDGARFAPGSRDVLFSARWNGEPPEVYSLNPAALEPRSLGLKGGTLLSVSSTGELALKMHPRLWASFELGQLARVTPGGGVRVIQESAFDSDWMPDGRQLALIGSGAGSSSATPGMPLRQAVLEFPGGHPVASEVVFTWGLRVSPRGDRLVCFEQPTYNRGDGSIVWVDLSGARKAICAVKGFTGLAWGPVGDEVWYSEFKDGCSSLWAVTTSGRKRLLTRQAGLLELLDVAPDGRVLASLGLVMSGTMGMSPPDYRERDLSWNDASFAKDISPDGRRLLVGGGGGWSSDSEHLPLYLRTPDGALPTHLGEADTARFMPDGQEVMTTLVVGGVPTLTLVPLGPGRARAFSVPELSMAMDAEPLSDGRRVLITAVGAKPFQLLDLSTAARTPIGEPGMTSTAGARAVSSDGAWVLLRRPSPNPFESPHIILSTRGVPSRDLKGIEVGEVPLRWDGAGTGIYVFNRDGFPTRITRIEVATGKRTLIREITPTNPAGLPGIRSFAMTPDARHLAYNYVRKLSDLYLIEGLK